MATSVLDYGAVGDGSTDDTAAIQATVAAVVSAGGGVVFVPAGVYMVSAPVVVASDCVWFLGEQAPVTMSSGGWQDGVLSVIRAAPSWSQGAAAQPAMLLWDAVTGGTPLNRGGVERLSIDGGNTTTLIHGIATYGRIAAFGADNVIVGGFYHADSIGINNIQGTTSGNLTPVGNTYSNILVQQCYGGGCYLGSGDLQVFSVHAQSCTTPGQNTGDGITIYGGAGDARVIGCRGDLSTNGFVIDATLGAANSYLGMVQLVGCSTQRNRQNGLKISNDEGQAICPVLASGCSFQGDGVSGGYNAGVRCSGQVVATLSNCQVLVDTVDVAGGAPGYAITTASDGTAPPKAVSVMGGFYNAVTAFSHQANAPGIAVVNCLAWIGGQWTISGTPTHQTAM